MPVESRRVKELFGAALDIPETAVRETYLDRECGNDAELRQRLDALLKAHEAPASAVKQPLAGEGTAAFTASEKPGYVVAGRYKLLESIGEGGMGTVWVAEQTEPVRRKVAVKLIKAGMDSRSVLARFEAERQALALMDHPNIAKVLDGGLSEQGRPYFVMEYVKGVPITEYCDTTRLSIQERLQLFIQVCQAVQHAHQKGIIHRDLKPSNILVAPYDDKPVPKIIDFGLAKAMHQSLTERTLHTAHESVLGTPLYMSPEQAQLNNLDVDTRSDIYSLGVLLYELLTGTTPLEKQRFKQAAWDEVRRIIQEEEPPRPSTRLSSIKALPTLAAGRHTEPLKLTRMVKGELDWIVMKALEKDRTRRYETANGFARDIQRYLSDEVVEARPVSAAYKLRKLVARNKGKVLAAGISLGVLLIGITGTTYGLIRANRAADAERVARDDAEIARQAAEIKSKEVLEGAERMNAANAAIALAAQYEIPGLWAEAETALNRAIELREDHSHVWMRRGDLYCRMGLWDLASKDYAIFFQKHPPENSLQWYFHALVQLMQGDEPGYRRTCGQMMDRFSTLPDGYSKGSLVRACSLIPGAVVDYNRLLGSYPKDAPKGGWVGLYFRGLGYFRAGRYEEAIRDLRNSLSSTGYPARALNYPVLAMALQHAGQPDAARQELENSRKEFNRWAQSAVVVPNRLMPWDSWWDWAEFQLLHREAHLLIDQKPLQEDARLNVLRGRAFATLGLVNRAVAEYELAIKLSPTVYEIRVELMRYHAKARRWTDAEAVLDGLKNLRPGDSEVHLEAFRIYADAGHLDKALAEFSKAAAMRPVDLPQMAIPLGSIGATRLQNEQYNDAERLFRECLAIREKHLPDDWSTFNTQSLLGGALLGQKKYAEAEPLLLKGYEGMKAREKTIPPQGNTRLPDALDRLIQLYTETSKPDEVKKWQAERDKKPAISKKK